MEVWKDTLLKDCLLHACHTLHCDGNVKFIVWLFKALLGEKGQQASCLVSGLHQSLQVTQAQSRILECICPFEYKFVNTNLISHINYVKNPETLNLEGLETYTYEFHIYICLTNIILYWYKSSCWQHCLVDCISCIESENICILSSMYHPPVCVIPA